MNKSTNCGWWYFASTLNVDLSCRLGSERIHQLRLVVFLCKPGNTKGVLKVTLICGFVHRVAPITYTWLLLFNRRLT